MFGVHTIRPWLPIALVVCSVGTGVAAAGQLTVSVTDGRGAPLAGAIVFLDAAAAARAVKPMPVVEMAQRNKTFVPDVLAVTKGTPVSFPNQDTVRHHVYSFSPVKKFELKLYTGVPAAPVVFDQPGVAVLGCNIHDQMVAWVVVLDTPYHGTTGADGRVVCGSQRTRARCPAAFTCASSTPGTPARAVSIVWAQAAQYMPDSRKDDSPYRPGVPEGAEKRVNACCSIGSSRTSSSEAEAGASVTAREGFTLRATTDGRNRDRRTATGR